MENIFREMYRSAAEVQHTMNWNRSNMEQEVTSDILQFQNIQGMIFALLSEVSKLNIFLFKSDLYKNEISEEIGCIFIITVD